VRTRHPGRLMIDMDSLATAAQLMNDVETAIREELGDRTLKDWIDRTHEAPPQSPRPSPPAAR
jgi:hypothetical protein